MQCIVWQDAGFQIASYSVKRQGSFSGKIKLMCGSAGTQGYRHIEAKHKKQWVQLVTWDNRSSASSWDNVMMRVVKGSLKNPTRVYSQKGNKMCFESAATSWRKDGRGRVVSQKTWTTAVVVSKNYKRVITAYPGACGRR